MSEKTKESDREKKIEEPAIDDPGPDEGSPSQKAAAAPRATGKIRRADLLKAKAGGASASATGTVEGGSSPVKEKKGKKGKKPEKEERTLELEPISPFKRGISIGVKFAALTAIVVAAAMVLLGTLTFQITSTEVDQQINQGGVQAAAMLEKGVDRIFWVAPTEVIKDLVEGKEPGEEPKDKDSPAHEDWVRTKKTYDSIKQHTWDKMRERAQQGLNERVKALVTGSGGQILSAAVGDTANRGAIALYPTELRITTPREISKQNGTTISECKLQQGDQGSILVRQFDRPITDEAGVQLKTPEGVPALATIFVNAQKIEDVQSNVWNRIMLVTAMGALAGIILTVLIAAVLSRPIRALEGDIAVVAEGNLEHETLVRSRDEIGALAHTFNIMTRNVKAAQGHAADRKAIERELSIATEIQSKLLPERLPQIPGLDIHSFYRSAKEVGGDYYDFIVIDQTHLGIIVADVSGKGIPGSMVMTMARSLVRLASVRNVSPADTFKKVNRILAKDIRRGMFVTSIYMVLNVKTHELKVASAGHNPLVIFRAESGQNELVKPQGIALGFDKGTIFDNNVQEMTIQLNPGDRICAYTDGVNEAMNAESEEFGDERFYNLVKQHARLSSKDFVQKIVAELEAHRGEAEQSDDITITTLAVMK
ncbi:MAG TPA: SpoIIE family protein phosphatase [Planctomycetota bacterium]|nr:SpoIIE family protein phosphatase [Planctomycetota bacterium]